MWISRINRNLIYLDYVLRKKTYGQTDGYYLIMYVYLFMNFKARRIKIISLSSLGLRMPTWRILAEL